MCDDELEILLTTLEEIYSCRSNESNNSQEFNCNNETKSCLVQNGNKRKRKITVANDSGICKEFEAFFPRPRIIKSDIRRSYANMFTNAINSSDFPLLFGFFDTFCTNQFSSKVTRNVRFVPFVYNHCSINEAAKFWCYHSAMLPDCITSVTDINIVFSDDMEGESKIECKYSLSATKIYEGGLLLLEDTKVEQNLSNTQECIQSISQSVEDKTNSLALLSNPVKISSEGTITFFVDGLRRLTKLVADCNAISIAPYVE